MNNRILPALLALLLLSGCADAKAPSASNSADTAIEMGEPADALPLAPVPLPQRTEVVCTPGTADAEFTLAKVDLPKDVQNVMIYGDSHPLIWYTGENGKWGACDWDGTEILPCQYDDIAQFCEDGVAAVEKNGLCGYVNLKGEELIPCQFACAAQFHDGVLLAGDDGMRYTVYDLESNVTGTLPAGINSGNTCGGFIQYYDEASGLYGYLNEDGSVAIPAAFSAVYPFGNGLAAAQDPSTGKKGFVDVSGQWAIAPKYDIISAGYADGYAVVAEDFASPSHTGGCGLIDAAGNPASNSDYLSILPFADGWAAYCREGCRGYLSKENIEYDLSSLLRDGSTPDSFSGGYAVYCTEGNLCGYLDSDLNIAVSAQFNSCSKVVNAQALVERTDGTFCVLSFKK